MRKVILAKLDTTEWIVGAYYNSSEEFIEDVYNLFILEDGKAMMVPYGAPFLMKGATIDSKHIMLLAHCPKELENIYIQSLTGLVVGPTKNAGLTLVK